MKLIQSLFFIISMMLVSFNPAIAGDALSVEEKKVVADELDNVAIPIDSKQSKNKQKENETDTLKTKQSEGKRIYEKLLVLWDITMLNLLQVDQLLKIVGNYA